METKELIMHLRRLGKYSTLEPNYLLMAADRLEELEEKQTPKKVKGFTGTCQCGKTIYSHMKYCNNCGQALDWGK